MFTIPPLSGYSLLWRGAAPLWRGAALGVVLAAGCAAEPLDDGLVTWSGYVYTSPQADVLFSKFAVGATGDETLEFVATVPAEDGAEDGAGGIAAEPVLATEPYEDYPGYWSVDLPPSARFTVRLSTDPVAVWRFWSPDRDASWFAGALFGAEADGVDALLTSLGEVVRSPADSGLATVIGAPWAGDTEAPWSCADIRVAGVAPACFSVDADGVVSSVADGPLSYFVATDLPAGDVRVESGLGAEDSYPLAAGEVGMAYWFHGSTE